MIGSLALACAAIFTGAACYVTFVEQPARLALEPSAALAQWRPAYARGYLMQASLAMAAGLLGLAEWLRAGDIAWAVGAVLMVANWPYTLVVIRPVNRRLEAAQPDRASPETITLLRRWGRLHAWRSGLGAAATVVYLVASAPMP